jgi:membrane fusion protein (multidrug efflux system)
MVGFLLAGIIQGLAANDVSGMIRRVAVDAPLAIVLMVGTITVVNRAVDPSRRTIEVWCEIPNTSHQIRAGVFGTVAVATGMLKQAIVVPIAAIQFEEGTNKGAVMVVDKDKKAVKRPVETAPAVGGKVSVLRGLERGETVIVQGGYGLPDGTAVQWPEAAKK